MYKPNSKVEILTYDELIDLLDKCPKDIKNGVLYQLNEYDSAILGVNDYKIFLVQVKEHFVLLKASNNALRSLLDDNEGAMV